MTHQWWILYIAENLDFSVVNILEGLNSRVMNTPGSLDSPMINTPRGLDFWVMKMYTGLGSLDTQLTDTGSEKIP